MTQNITAFAGSTNGNNTGNVKFAAHFSDGVVIGYAIDSVTSTNSAVATGDTSGNITLTPGGAGLVAGGGDQRDPGYTAEVFDPTTQTFTPTAAGPLDPTGGSAFEQRARSAKPGFGPKLTRQRLSNCPTAACSRPAE